MEGRSFMKKADVVSSIIIFALGTWTMLQSTKLSYRHLYAPGPGFLPFWIGIFLIVSGAALFIRSVRDASQQKIAWPQGTMAVRLFIIAFSFLVYLVLIPFLGYAACTVLFCIFLIKILSMRSTWTNSFIVADLITIPIVLVIEIWFKVPLPKGYCENFPVSGILELSAFLALLLFVLSAVKRKAPVN
jgi:hypothetical protein